MVQTKADLVGEFTYAGNTDNQDKQYGRSNMQTVLLK